MGVSSTKKWSDPSEAAKLGWSKSQRHTARMSVFVAFAPH